MKTRIFGLIVRIAVLAALVSCMCLLAVRAYGFGKAVFDEREGTAKKPRSVLFVLKEENTISQVADVLEEEGFIDDSLVFIVQKYFYNSELVPGEYRLNTNMTGKMILDILSGAAVETEESS
ncbi:MAG: endolytic transglycosylase MltG [Lachnospiraceae bacterium]|nr:endolytic transglycosylase MltG [Lachnospiraceae bacterium]